MKVCVYADKGPTVTKVTCHGGDIHNHQEAVEKIAEADDADSRQGMGQQSVVRCCFRATAGLSSSSSWCLSMGKENIWATGRKHAKHRLLDVT